MNLIELKEDDELITLDSNPPGYKTVYIKQDKKEDYVSLLKDTTFVYKNTSINVENCLVINLNYLSQNLYNIITITNADDFNLLDHLLLYCISAKLYGSPLLQESNEPRIVDDSIKESFLFYCDKYINMWYENAVEDALGQLDDEDFLNSFTSIIRAAFFLSDMTLILKEKYWIRSEYNFNSLDECGPIGIDQKKYIIKLLKIENDVIFHENSKTVIDATFIKEQLDILNSFCLEIQLTKLPVL